MFFTIQYTLFFKNKRLIIKYIHSFDKKSNIFINIYCKISKYIYYLKLFYFFFIKNHFIKNKNIFSYFLIILH